MTLTQQEQQLLREAETYRVTPWRDKILIIALVCGVVGACVMIVAGGVKMAVQREGYMSVAAGCIFLSFAGQAYSVYTLRKRCFLLIQKLQTQISKTHRGHNPE
jgi:hypothetical protein